MKIEDLDGTLLSKILDYIPPDDIFASVLYSSRKFKILCQEYTFPTEIDTYKLQNLDSNQMCQLIKNSSALQSFHFNSLRVYGDPRKVHVDPAIVECLSEQATSLKKLTMSKCFADDGKSLISLINSGLKFTELEIFGMYSKSFYDLLNHHATLSSLPFMTKLSLRECGFLEIKGVMKLIDACPCLKEITLYRLGYPGDQLVNYLIRKRGPQLKYLNYDEHRDDESLNNLSLCAQVETLHLRYMENKSANFKFPLLPNVRNLTLEYINGDKIRGCDVQSRILESFPNLTHLTFLYSSIVTMRTAQCISRLQNLRKLCIDSARCCPKILLYIFRSSRSLKFARIDDTILEQMSEDDAKVCFGRLRTLQVYYEFFRNEEIVLLTAKRLANWLPEIHVYLCRNCVYNPVKKQPTRIWPNHCHFQS